MDIDAILLRTKIHTGLKKNKEVADLLGISANDFSNRKKRGTLLSVIIEWATNENVSLDWLLKGSESEKATPDQITLKINQMLEDMPEEKRRDVLKYAEEKKLLAELLADTRGKKQGGAA